MVPNIVKEEFQMFKQWKDYPYYRLEERIDIFFALYLPEILKCADSNINFDYDDIFPQFPLRKTEKTKNGKHTIASNKADFAVFSEVGKTKKVLTLVELKTDMNSFNLEQINYYKKAKSFQEIMNDLIEIQKGTNEYEKYDNLLMKLKKYKFFQVDGEKERKKTKNIKRTYWKYPDKDIMDRTFENDIRIVYIIPNKNKKIKIKKREETIEKVIMDNFENDIKKIKIIDFEDIINKFNDIHSNDLVFKEFLKLLNLIK